MDKWTVLAMVLGLYGRWRDRGARLSRNAPLQIAQLSADDTVLSTLSDRHGDGGSRKDEPHRGSLGSLVVLWAALLSAADASVLSVRGWLRGSAANGEDLASACAALVATVAGGAY